MIHSERRVRLGKTMLVLILVFIWGNSLLPGSVSLAFSNAVRQSLSFLFPGGLAGGAGLLRKIAHFAEFGALGMTLAWLCGMDGRGKLLPLILGMAAACIDESLQCITPGRGPGIKDVLLDSAGVLTGILLIHLGHTILVKRRKT